MTAKLSIHAPQAQFMHKMQFTECTQCTRIHQKKHAFAGCPKGQFIKNRLRQGSFLTSVGFLSHIGASRAFVCQTSGNIAFKAEAGVFGIYKFYRSVNGKSAACAGLFTKCGKDLRSRRSIYRAGFRGSGGNKPRSRSHKHKRRYRQRGEFFHIDTLRIINYGSSTFYIA